MTSVPNIVVRLTLLEKLTTEATVLSSASTTYVILVLNVTILGSNVMLALPFAEV